MLLNALMLFLLGTLVFFIYRYYQRLAQPQWEEPKSPFPASWKTLLSKNVSYYEELDAADKLRFETKVNTFLSNCTITGIQTEVSVLDRLLVASSAVIPIFGFPNWHYPNVREVLLYPNNFDEQFQFEGSGSKNILGMVGDQHLEGLVILSKRALHQGFKNEMDKQNTAIHEFVHLIDKADGAIDGIPKILMDRQYALPWIDLIHQEMNRIAEGDSDINPYAATNTAEFLAVISEYFFERPKLMEKNHPKLYALLETFFQQDMAQTVKK